MDKEFKHVKNSIGIRWTPKYGMKDIINETVKHRTKTIAEYIQDHNENALLYMLKSNMPKKPVSRFEKFLRKIGFREFQRRAGNVWRAIKGDEFDEYY